MNRLTIKQDDWEKRPRGCDCRFIERDGFGFKLYAYKHTRNRSYLNQTMLARKSLAPRCWEPFEIEVTFVQDYGMAPRIGTYYGFATELAHTVDRSVFEKCYYEHGDANPFVRSVYLEVENLHKAIRETGMNWGDRNYFNAGIADDGRMVLLDCAESGMIPGLQE